MDFIKIPFKLLKSTLRQGRTVTSSRIVRRLLVSAVMVGIVSSLIWSSLDSYQTYNHRLKELRDILVSIGEITAPSLAQSAWVFDNEQISIQLKSIAGLPAVTQAQLHLKDGGIMQFGSVSSGISVIKHSFPLLYHEDNNPEYLGELILIRDKREEEKKAYLVWWRSFFSNTLIIFMVIPFLLYFETFIKSRAQNKNSFQLFS